MTNSLGSQREMNSQALPKGDKLPNLTQRGEPLGFAQGWRTHELCLREMNSLDSPKEVDSLCLPKGEELLRFAQEGRTFQNLPREANPLISS